MFCALLLRTLTYLYVRVSMACMDWTRLAQVVRARRLSLDLGQVDLAARSRITNVTISRLENGNPVAARTLWRLDRGLAWEPGSAERVLHGGDPAELPTSGETYTDPDEAALWALVDLPEDRRRELIAELRLRRAERHGTDTVRSRPTGHELPFSG